MRTRFGCLLSVCLCVSLSAAQPSSPTRVAVAKVTSPPASFVARQAEGKPFEVLRTGADIHSGDTLVALPGASLVSNDGGVAVKSFADYDSRSPLPILETALVLAVAEKGENLSFLLDRGRVDVTNQKASGEAVVSVRFADQKWTIKLAEPGARVALEYCGRWPAGTRFKLADPKGQMKGPVPVSSLVLLVLSGTVQVSSRDSTLALTAPPGPAMLEWDSIAGGLVRPQKVTAIPEWADSTAAPSSAAKRVAAAIEKFRAARAEDPSAALKEFLSSRDPVEQRVAMVTLGAQDDLAALGESLGAAKRLEEWDFGITVLRHWLGRCPGQEQKFYQRLTSVRGYSPAQAEIVVQLLFGFSPAEVRAPETYQVLIDYLAHEKPAVRNLAAWHLVRLVPQGREIPFKPSGTVLEAAKTQEAWKKLIPMGELPPRPPKK